ncbi:hypothetical protein QKW52_25490 [Bacillus sonorensis]|nr:hypothetical protein [Bacillus sonorensis]
MLVERFFLSLNENLERRLRNKSSKSDESFSFREAFLKPSHDDGGAVVCFYFCNRNGFTVRHPLACPGQSITPVELHSKNILLVLSEREMTVEKSFSYISNGISTVKKG